MVIINSFPCTAVCELVVEPCLRNCTLLPVFKALLVLLAFLGFLAWCLFFSGIFGRRFFFIPTPFINSTPTSISNCLGHLGLVSLRN